LNNLAAKFRYIYLQIFLVTVGFTAACIPLHVLSGYFQILSNHKAALEFVSSGALAGVFILIWVRPRTRLLRETKSISIRFTVQVCVWVALTSSSVLLQTFIDLDIDKPTVLENIADINNLPDSKYYVLRQCFPDKHKAKEYSWSALSGRNNEDLIYRMNILIPLHKDINDTATCAWYGIEYSKTISNRLAADEKENEWKQFVHMAQEKFENTNLSQFTCLEDIRSGDVRGHYLKALKATGDSPSSAKILVPHSGSFAGTGSNKLQWFQGIFFGAQLLVLLMIIFLPADEIELQKYWNSYKEHGKKNGDLLHYFIPSGDHFVTSIIVDINVLVFIFMRVSGQSFIGYGEAGVAKMSASFGLLSRDCDWWLLCTTIFVHGSMVQLLLNTYFLFFAGTLLEPVMGRAKYLIAYLVTGLTASLAGMWWHGATVSVGASGAIFGLYGIFLAFMLLKVFPKKVTAAMLASTLVFIGYNLLMGIAGGVDNAAHIGGLASGFLLGFLLYPFINKNKNDPDANWDHADANVQ